MYTSLDFLALPPSLSSPERSRAVLVPVPYDATASFKGGAREGPRAIIEVSRELEEYDAELGCEVCSQGIYTAPLLEPHMGGPEAMIGRVQEAVAELASGKDVVGVLGGEHTITIGAVRAMRARYPDLSVLYLDAHPDLREQYMGTKFGHASTARRLIEEGGRLVQVGVRTWSLQEEEFIRQQGIPAFLDRGMEGKLPSAGEVLPHLSPSVYVSVDLDVFDPALMPAVGNPVPGGPGWRQVVSFLKGVAAHRRIVGFDVMELCPEQGPWSCAFVAASLVYKLLGYALVLPKDASAERMG